MIREKIEGLEFENNSNSKFKVIEFLKWDKVNGSLYKIKFESGYETEAYQKCIKRGSIKDVYQKNIHSVACLGKVNYKDNKKLYSIWNGMVRRCYEKDINGNFTKYGKRGVVVCERWLCFEYFLEDSDKIEGYDEDLINSGKLQLDKDYKNCEGKEYSLENCIWIDKSLNCKFQKDKGQRDIIIKKDNIFYIFSSIREMCRYFNFGSGNISKLLNGKIKKYKNLEVSYYNGIMKDNYVDFRIKIK